MLVIRVVINGLVEKPELNGRTCTVVSFDVDTGCYLVEVAESGTFKRLHRVWNSQDDFASPDNSSSFLIKPCNLLKCGITTDVVKVLVSDTFAAVLVVVPVDDWGRTWSSDRTFRNILRMTSKLFKDTVNKLRPPTIVKLRRTFWDDVRKGTAAEQGITCQNVGRREECWHSVQGVLSLIF